jgi:ATP-dependent DNA helicase DinG
VTLGHAWTEQQDEELRDGVDLGCSLEELAEQLDLEPELIAARVAGLGLVLGQA